jgi:hypothetical protein
MSISDSTAQDRNTSFAYDTLRQQFNLLVAETNYFRLNGLASSTVATAPVVATATTTSKVKTTNATVVRSAGALVALGATDNYWTLTGGDLAVSSFRRYLLCTNAAGTASVVASGDSIVSAAACRWSALPAAGVAILGILTVATDSTHTFTPATTLLGAAGITATYVDGIDVGVPLATIVTP